MFKSRVSLVAAVATIALAVMIPSQAASAQPVPLETPDDPETPWCDDASFSVGFSKCWVFDGNDKNQDVPLFLNTNEPAGANWTRLGATDADVGEGESFFPFEGTSDELQTGTLQFDGSISGWFALAFKQGSLFSLYTFNSALAIESLTFDVTGTGLNGDDLSHITFYDGKDAPPVCIPGVDCPDPSIVPEPTSFALMFGGLLGLGVAARRRRNS